MRVVLICHSTRRKICLACLFQLHWKVTCWAFAKGGWRKETSPGTNRPEDRQKEGAREWDNWEGEAIQQRILPRTRTKASKAGSRQLERWNIKIMNCLYWSFESCDLWGIVNGQYCDQCIYKWSKCKKPKGYKVTRKVCQISCRGLKHEEHACKLVMLLSSLAAYKPVYCPFLLTSFTEVRGQVQIQLLLQRFTHDHISRADGWPTGRLASTKKDDLWKTVLLCLIYTVAKI